MRPSHREELPRFIEPMLASVEYVERQVIMDAELVCFGADGKPDFAALRARFGRRNGRVASAAHRGVVKLVAFDLLHLDGAAVRRLPYSRRGELLAELVVDGPALIAPRHFVKQREAVLSVTAEQGLEGGSRQAAACCPSRMAPPRNYSFSVLVTTTG